LKQKGTKARVTGLERFGLNEGSFRRLGSRKVLACVHLRTYDVTPAVRRLTPSKRIAYMTARVDRWIESMYRHNPELSFQAKVGKPSGGGLRRWSQLPSSLVIRGPARGVSALSRSTGVRLVSITRVAGRRRRRPPKPALEWYCVRALVVIRVEGEKSGMQTTEDRFMLVRASYFEDAKKRLRRHWREYARPYLNAKGQMVSWQFDQVVDIYWIGQTNIDPTGSEVYSKLGQRRMRPKYVWRPKQGV